MTAKDSAPLVVAIDGPAGAGKSTVAARIAARFGLLNLETGAMYRAFALKAIQTDSDLDDREELDRLAARTRIRLLPAPLGNRVFLDEVDVTKRIREADVTAAASRVSVHPAIRRVVGFLATPTRRKQRHRDGREGYRHHCFSPRPGKDFPRRRG